MRRSVGKTRTVGMVGMSGQERTVEAVVSIPGAEPWSAAGSGERGAVGVIVTHGFTGNPASTRPLGQRLAAEGFSVEVPVLPGHGTDHHDLARTRYSDWVGAVERLVDHLRPRLEYLILVGHSMGGTLSLDIASRRPTEIDAVVSINAPLTDRGGLLATLSPLLQYLVPSVPRGLAGMPPNDVARPGVRELAYDRVPARAAHSLLVELPRIRAQLLDLTQPLLVVRSLVDHTVPPRDGLELQELVGSADVREMLCERSYHVVMLDHDGPAVEAAVVEFVTDVTGS